jgi:hypothetical protein
MGGSCIFRGRVSEIYEICTDVIRIFRGGRFARFVFGLFSQQDTVDKKALKITIETRILCSY